MNIKNLLTKIEKVFISIGFEKININDEDCFSYGEFYCKFSYVKQLKAIVIETADNKQEALINRYEDSDVYYIDDNLDDEVTEMIRRDLMKYYIS